jgi:hypothetical protein
MSSCCLVFIDPSYNSQCSNYSVAPARKLQNQQQQQLLNMQQPLETRAHDDEPSGGGVLFCTICNVHKVMTIGWCGDPAPMNTPPPF